LSDWQADIVNILETKVDTMSDVIATSTLKIGGGETLGVTKYREMLLMRDKLTVERVDNHQRREILSSVPIMMF
jgi:hypothetical protein